MEDRSHATTPLKPSTAAAIRSVASRAKQTHYEACTYLDYFKLGVSQINLKFGSGFICLPGRFSADFFLLLHILIVPVTLLHRRLYPLLVALVSSQRDIWMISHVNFTVRLMSLILKRLVKPPMPRKRIVMASRIGRVSSILMNLMEETVRWASPEMARRAWKSLAMI